MSNHTAEKLQPLLTYSLVKTTRRLTFDIIQQAERVTYAGDDGGPYFKFVASNGYEVISRSRMDIQTERIWLLGAKRHEEARSGTMVFSSDAKRDAAYAGFVLALNEWAAANGGTAELLPACLSHPAGRDQQPGLSLAGEQPAAVSDEAIDRICYLATEIRFAKTDDAAQAVIDQIRAILALRPQAVPMTEEQIAQMYDAEVDIDPENSWEAYQAAVRSYEASLGITAPAGGEGHRG